MERTTIKIAEECGVNKDVINLRFEKFGINYKTQEYLIKLNTDLCKENLIKWYVDEEKSISTISKETCYDSGAIRKKLKEFNIHIRSFKEYAKTKEWINLDLTYKHKNISKEFLYDQYVNQEKSPREIGKLLNLDRGSIANLLRRHNISLVSNKESRKRLSAKAQGLSTKEWTDYDISENQRDRKSGKYIDWRKHVYERDNYRCQNCFCNSHDINAHHIENYSSQKELRFVVENGICLCENCHNLFHTTFGRHNNNEIQLQSFIDNFDIYNENVLCKVA